MYIFSKNSWLVTCYCEFYLCYSPQKTVLTFSSLQVAVRSRHARTVQTSDYSAMAWKFCYSVIKEKICFTNFLFGPRNSHPHVYWSVPGDGFKKPFTGWFLRIKASSFAVILLVLTHSYILCLPIVVCTLESYLNQFSPCAGMLCLSLRAALFA